MCRCGPWFRKSKEGVASPEGRGWRVVGRQGGPECGGIAGGEAMIFGIPSSLMPNVNARHERGLAQVSLFLGNRGRQRR
jgi:hypothetical protein